MEEFTHPGFVAAASSAIRVSGSSRTAVGDEVPPSPAARRAAGWTRRVGAGKFSRATENAEICVAAGWRCRSQVWHRPGFAVTNLTAGPRKRGIPVPPRSLMPPPCGSGEIHLGAQIHSHGRFVGILTYARLELGHRHQPPLKKLLHRQGARPH